MFTGLVAGPRHGRGASTRRADGVRLRGRAPRSRGEIAEGDSVAVNGVCLTATAIADGALRRRRDARDAAPLLAGRGAARARAVNLELPLRAADRLGGHVVQGHVDGVGDGARACARTASPASSTIAAPPELLRYVVEKGSIAVDGVSLTVAAVDDDGVRGRR